VYADITALLICWSTSDGQVSFLLIAGRSCAVSGSIRGLKLLVRVVDKVLLVRHVEAVVELVIVENVTSEIAKVVK